MLEYFLLFWETFENGDIIAVEWDFTVILNWFFEGLLLGLLIGIAFMLAIIYYVIIPKMKEA